MTQTHAAQAKRLATIIEARWADAARRDARAAVERMRREFAREPERLLRALEALAGAKELH